MNTDQLIVFLHELSHVGPSITPEHVRDIAQKVEKQTPTSEEVQEAATNIQQNVTMQMYMLHLDPSKEDTSNPLMDTSNKDILKLREKTPVENTPDITTNKMIQQLNVCLDILYDDKAVKSTFALTDHERAVAHLLYRQAENFAQMVMIREQVDSKKGTD